MQNHLIYARIRVASVRVHLSILLKVLLGIFGYFKVSALQHVAEACYLELSSDD